MVSEVVSDLQLTPQSREPVAAAAEVTEGQPHEPEDGPHMRYLFKRWALASVALLVLCALSVQGFMELRTYQSRKLSDEHSVNQSTVPGSVQASTAAGTSETAATEPAPKPPRLVVTVEPGQTIQDISVQYLGGFDLQRLHQIQALNPELTDPNFILIGQKIRLPGPPLGLTVNSSTPPTNVRKLP
jgi:LysM repeat protein